MVAKYKNVSLPDKLIERIDTYIENNLALDFRSRAEVVKFALRKLFLEKE